MPDRQDEDERSRVITEQWCRHHRLLLRYLRWRLRARAQEAEDLVQDVFRNLLQYWTAFLAAKDPKAYLFRVAANVLNRYLGEPHHEPLPDIECLESFDPIDQFISAAEVQAVLNGLTPEEQAIIWLRYVDEQLPQQIAEETGLSKDQVERRLTAARRRLKEIRNERKD